MKLPKHISHLLGLIGVALAVLAGCTQCNTYPYPTRYKDTTSLTAYGWNYEAQFFGRSWSMQAPGRFWGGIARLDSTFLLTVSIDHEISASYKCRTWQDANKLWRWFVAHQDEIPRQYRAQYYRIDMKEGDDWSETSERFEKREDALRVAKEMADLDEAEGLPSEYRIMRVIEQRLIPMPASPYEPWRAPDSLDAMKAYGMFWKTLPDPRNEPEGSPK